MATLLLKHTVSEHEFSQKVLGISNLQIMLNITFKAFTLMLFKKKKSKVSFDTQPSTPVFLVSYLMTCLASDSPDNFQH